MSAVCFAPLALMLGLFAPGKIDATCRALQMSAADTAGAVGLPAYGFVFLVNWLLEAPAYGIAGRVMGCSPRTIASQIVGLNLATHPIVYFALPALAERQGWTLLTLASVSEGFAFAAEAALLRAVWNYPWRAAAAASFFANLTSWWAGAYLSGTGLLP